jgi:hypothetical protein
MTLKIPMKFRVLQLICERSIDLKTIDTYQIIKLINLEYGSERQCSKKTIKTHILALKSIGLIKEIHVYESNNELISEYKSTREGFNRMKLMPSGAESYKEWVPFKRRAYSLVNHSS